MRALRSIVLLCGLLLTSCGKHHAPDETLLSDLETAISITLDGMALPASARPSQRALRDQAARLGWRAGDGPRAPDAAITRARAQRVLTQLATERPRAQAPAMLVWLSAHAETLTPAQTTLLDCLVLQLAADEHLKLDAPAQSAAAEAGGGVVPAPAR